MPDEENKNSEVATPSDEVVENTINAEEKPAEVVEIAPSPEPVVVTPVATTAVTPEVAPQQSAGTLVLQWLTYAFWGWLILAMIWLAGIVFSNAILDESLAGGTFPFAFATTVVLLPIAFFTDRFYRKHEPLTKTGGAAIIMVLHAVLFALLGIITLIWTVFTSINLLGILTNTTENSVGIVSCLTTGFATLLYAAAFLRTLNPFKSTKPLNIYSIAMVAVTILLLVLMIVGPFAKAAVTRNDRLIEQNLSTVHSNINKYVEDNSKLPDSLNDVTFSSDAANQLVDDGLVTYKKEASTIKVNANSTAVEHRYQLCVTYTAASSNKGTYDTSYRINNEAYSEYASTSSHDKGKECYKLKTTTYVYKDNDNAIDTLEKM